ncbi:hypothetical protein PG996_003122 [Apiospora saccharicola]|uniref:Uncharacterized protein n=1 Tax=Apiospora saccharicola TaxID=335842 RepID=A0ABR1W0C9_9PEZI
MSRDSLESVELREVELRSGTWQQVLESLSEAPRLTSFRMELCGYSMSGLSRALRAPHVPEPDVPTRLRPATGRTLTRSGRYSFESTRIGRPQGFARSTRLPIGISAAMLVFETNSELTRGCWPMGLFRIRYLLHEALVG